MALNSVRKSLSFDDETLVHVKIVQSKILRDTDLDNIQIKFGNTKHPQSRICTFKNHPILLKSRQYSDYEKEYESLNSEHLKFKKLKSNPSNGWLCSNLQDYLKCDKEEDQIKDFMARTLKSLQDNDLKSRISSVINISPQKTSHQEKFLLDSDQFVESIYNSQNKSISESSYKKHFKQLFPKPQNTQWN